MNTNPGPRFGVVVMTKYSRVVGARVQTREEAQAIVSSVLTVLSEATPAPVFVDLGDDTWVRSAEILAVWVAVVEDDPGSPTAFLSTLARGAGRAN